LTRLPQLEAQLVAAAGKRRPRARRPLLFAGGALAVAACVAAALLLAPESEPQRRERPVTAPETVPAATLVKARALAAAPPSKRVAVPDGELAAAARRTMERIPYPPGVRDRFDWARRTYSINYSDDLEQLAEYRSYCLWLRYWLAGTDRAGAAAVIAEVPRWPMQRRSVIHRAILTAVRDGDVAPIEREVAANCSGAR
jgi:hypothetical protein